MQNVSTSDIAGKVMHLLLFSKTHTRTYGTFPQRLVFHGHRYIGLCMMIFFTLTTSEKFNNFYQEIMPFIYNFADSWKNNHSS